MHEVRNSCIYANAFCYLIIHICSLTHYIETAGSACNLLNISRWTIYGSFSFTSAHSTIKSLFSNAIDNKRFEMFCTLQMLYTKRINSGMIIGISHEEYLCITNLLDCLMSLLYPKLYKDQFSWCDNLEFFYFRQTSNNERINNEIEWCSLNNNPSPGRSFSKAFWLFFRSFWQQVKRNKRGKKLSASFL